MSTQAKGSRRGISIRVIHLAMILCALAIAALLFFSTLQSNRVFSTLSRETENYIVRQKAAHDLMEASDYLTQMVQRFTLEGDTQYLNNYFDEAFSAKRREAAILSMSENGADQALVQQLQEAMEASQTLMYTEYYAMTLVTEALEIRDVPENFPVMELKEEDLFLSAEEKMELAQKTVMGNEYYASKEVIRTRLKDSLETLDEQMGRARQETSAQMMRELTMERMVVLAMAAVLIVLIFVTARLVTMPLLKADESIRKKRKMPVEGAAELRDLARSYNELHDTLQAEAPDR